LYFSEIKWFREHFEATTFLLLPEFLTVILTMYCVILSGKHWHNKYSVLLCFHVLIFSHSLCMKYSGLKYVCVCLCARACVCFIKVFDSMVWSVVLFNKNGPWIGNNDGSSQGLIWGALSAFVCGKWENPQETSPENIGVSGGIWTGSFSSKGAQDILVYIRNSYRLDGSGFESPRGKSFSPLHTLPYRPFQSPTKLLYNGYRDPFPGFKRLCFGVDHSLAPSAKVIYD